MVTARRASGSGADGLEIVFDDERLVADAGLVLPAILCDRLGAQAVLDAAIAREDDPAIGAGAGAKVLSVVFAMLAGGDSIDDTDRLRAGASGAVLGFRPRAGSTAGKWLGGSDSNRCASSTPRPVSCSGGPGTRGPDPSGW